MLIAGRAIQGLGSGGINMIVDIVVSDLVPLRERGNFIAIILTTYSVAASIGPFVGGAIVEATSWRWVFYLNRKWSPMDLLDYVGVLTNYSTGRRCCNGHVVHLSACQIHRVVINAEAEDTRLYWQCLDCCQ